MKKGHIILGTAAMVVSAVSALAFRAHSKFLGRQLYGATASTGFNCTLSTCHTVGGSGNQGVACRTANGSHSKALFTALANNGHATYWTNVTSTNGVKCTHPVTRWTHATAE